jgi:hypothetical protein
MLLRNCTFILLCALVIFNSCKKSGGNSSGPTVYAAGYWGNTRYSVAAYWVNGRLVSLTDSTQYGIAVAICASGNDVYAAGTVGALANSSSNVATYWKNGQAVHLGTPGLSSAEAIAVEGSDVYVAGGDGGYPVYWQNGQEVILKGGRIPSDGISIAVSGGDVYVVGEDSLFNPCYWKNGQLIELPGVDRQAAAIAASGNNVYVAGRQIDSATGTWEAILWTNGAPSMLSADTLGSGAGTLAIDGPDVYVGGNVGNVSAVWKNGQPFPMPATPSYRLYAWSMVVEDGKVYVGGNALSLDPSPISQAAYWSADGLVILDKNPAQGSNIWGIFVK